MFKNCIGYLFIIALLFVPLSVSAGNLDSSAAPGDAGSAMYTLEDIYNRLDAGTAGTKRSGAFVEPSSGPASTGKTTDEIMGKTPVVDNADGLTPGNAPDSVTFWGLNSGAWGLQTGSNANVVDTSTGDAVAGDITSGKKAWVDGSEVTGNAAVSAYVGKTRQTTCYDVAGSVTTCGTGIGTGQDGDSPNGVSWPNPRFSPDADGTGTVTDNLTGLIWLKDASCTDVLGGVTFSSEKLTWADALAWSNAMADGSCGLSDGSSTGDWRLPNFKELFSLIDAEYFDPALSDDAGTGKWGAGGTSSFSGVQLYCYWSSITYSSITTHAWYVDLSSGDVIYAGKTWTCYVWPVRGGQ